MSRDDLYERYLSEAERFLKSEASSAQLVKQECDRWDRESNSAKSTAGKKKTEIDRLAHQAQEGFSQLSKRLEGSRAKDVGIALPNMVRPIASNEDAADLASSLSGLIKKIDCYIEMIEKDTSMNELSQRSSNALDARRAALDRKRLLAEEEKAMPDPLPVKAEESKGGCLSQAAVLCACCIGAISLIANVLFGLL